MTLAVAAANRSSMLPDVPTFAESGYPGIVAGPWFALLAVSGVILGAVYMLDVTQKVFFGAATNPKNRDLTDLNSREWAGLAPLVVAIFALGLFPMYFRDRIDPSVRSFLAVYNSKREALRDGGGAHLTPWLLEEAATTPPVTDPGNGLPPPAVPEAVPHAARAQRSNDLLVAQGN